MPHVITSVDSLDFTVEELPEMELPRQVLMVKPTYFSVDYVINPHMADHVGMVDKVEAASEWEKIHDLYDELGFTVHVIEGVEGLPDMVFSANQSLPFSDEEGKRKVVMSIMHADERKEEVPYIEQWYRQAGYEICYLEDDSVSDFEGCGDAIWHTGRKLLWGGYGFRSSLSAHRQVSEMLDVPVIALKLVEESFYHLDTCFCVLDEKTALIYPDAFDRAGQDLIHAVFEQVIEAPQFEALEKFACNASCPDGKNVIIQQGCTDVNKKLRDAGFSVHEVETGEYLKSGGSVFCMKMMAW